MLGTDRYAYNSKINTIDPVDKLLISGGILLLCLLADRWQVSLFTFFAMSFLNISFGGHSWSDLGRMLRLPLVFIGIGVLTVMISRYPDKEALIGSLKIGNFYYGFSATGLSRSFSIFAKSFGVISSVYFFVMNTPLTDVSVAMERLHVPALFTEIMELTYRFIFLLWDSAQRIYIAQSSRLGYKSYKTAFHSTGDLAARVFFEAMRRGEKIYTAMESRGYTGTIITLGMDYKKNERLIGLGTVIAGIQIILLLLVRRYG